MNMITPLDHALWMEQALREAGSQHLQAAMSDRLVSAQAANIKWTSTLTRSARRTVPRAVVDRG
jgi:hypothetical protein